MEINLFTQPELNMVFKVLRTALSPGELNKVEKSFLKTYAKITNYNGSLNPSMVSTYEIHLQDPHKAKRLVQLAAMAALLANPLRLESIQFVQQLDKHLKTHEPIIPVLFAVIKKNRIKARLLTVRRLAGVILGEAYRAEGFLGVLRFFAALFARIRVNRNKLWNYKRLGLLPEGTLGREYWKHITDLGFGFPGEPGGIPETVSYHDVSHVLNEYDTSPLGEIQQGSFQGGCRKEGGFSFVQFVILQFHQGIQITPVARGEVGYFNPELVLWALHRGASFKVDVTKNWNYWPLMELPLVEAQQKCGLIPKLQN